MTVTDRPGPIGHPAWCARLRPGCDDRSHRSAALTVALDRRAGTEVRVSLWGDRHLFVELCFTSEAHLDPAQPIGMAAVAGDPELVTDPHGHDLSLMQAEALYRALGYLLTVGAERDPGRQEPAGAPRWRAT